MTLPLSLSSSFFFPALFSLSPLLLFTHFIHLHFLPLHTISSLENHFPRPLTCFRSSPSKSFQIFVFLTIFATNPFFETHLQTFIFFFFLHCQWHLPMGLPFLLLMGKKYHPSLEWNEEEGLLQDPKTHAPHSKKRLQGELIFWFLCWQICWFHVLLEA